MDIYDYAMQLEKEGEDLYKKFADTTNDPMLTNIFTWLAQQEKQHYDIFKKMKEDQPIRLDPPVSFINDVKNIFSEWKKQKVPSLATQAQADVYRTALTVEQKSIDLYTKDAILIHEPEKEKIFLRLASEEKKHFVIVENIIEFISKPEHWVEHAEFTHDLEKDYYL
ncbi:MAG: ferritin family protein [Candidatus Omnitrophica bacterium]|nr:ferritin family protein [Candidatus Omnitrophota bacterium]